MSNNTGHNRKDTSTYPEPEQLFTDVKPTTMLGKIIQFPLTRFVLVLAFLSPVNLGQMSVDSSIDGSTEWLKPIIAIGATVLMYIAYCLYTRLIERRKAWEMSFPGGAAEFGKGFAIGTALMTVVVAVLAIGGYYTIESFNLNGVVVAKALSRMFSAAFIEEVVFRLIIFKITEEALGSWAALIIQAGVFGLMHAGNPNATWFTSVAIMVEAGVLLAAVFMYTRRVWMIFGLHLAWNFVQSTVFGLNVSGHTIEGLITPSVTGPTWLTGGEFGVEASWLAIGICLTVGLIILKRAVDTKRIVPPAWRRSPVSSIFTADTP